MKYKDKIYYGWVVVIIVLIIGASTEGIRNSFGVFFKSLESEFDLTRAATSSIFSANMLFSAVFNVIAGWALDKYGPRLVVFLLGLATGLSMLLVSQTSAPWQLFISYGVLLSLGTGPSFPVLMSTVSRWFERKRGLALGIAASGASLGMLALAPFATYLIVNFNWRIAFIVIGVIAWSIVLPLSRLLRTYPHQIGALPDGARADSDGMKIMKNGDEGSIMPVGFSLKQALGNLGFWFILAVYLFYGFCIFLIYTHLVPYATDMGISAMAAATVISLIAGISILGRLVMGIVSDRIGRRIAAIICAVFTAATMVWLTWSHDLWMLYLFAVVFGFAYGGLDICMVALVGDVFGVRSIGAIIGALSVGFVIGSAIGPSLGGLIFDVSNSYSMAFLIGAVAMLIIALLIALIRPETVKSP
ncbi:MFS transporter [Chloroflexota bacterium]